MNFFNLLFPIINRWNRRFNTSNDFSQANYQLVIVGGMAYNAHLPKDKIVETKDLDLKLVYDRPVKPRAFFSLFLNKFNPLRTRIMLEFKHVINKYILENKHNYQNLMEFSTNEFVTVGIAYKYPYLIYDNIDARNCAIRYPNMIHMVYSLLYHQKDQDMPTSLVDLSMFIDINNPDYLYGRTLEIELYQQYYQNQQLNHHKSLIPLIATDHKNMIFVPTIGFILSDLSWLIKLHHRENRRDAFRLKYQNLLKHLEELKNSEVSSIVTLIQNNQDDNQILFQLFNQLTKLQYDKKIPIYNH